MHKVIQLPIRSTAQRLSIKNQDATHSRENYKRLSDSVNFEKSEEIDQLIKNDKTFAKTDFAELTDDIKKGIIGYIKNKSLHDIHPIVQRKILKYAKNNATKTNDMFLSEILQTIFAMESPVQHSPARNIFSTKKTHIIAARHIESMATTLMPSASTKGLFSDVEIKYEIIEKENIQFKYTLQIPEVITTSRDVYTFDFDQKDILLGTGEYSAILRARRTDGKRVAIKIIANDKGSHTKQFLLEYLTLLRLSGMNSIIQIYDAGTYIGNLENEPQEKPSSLSLKKTTANLAPRFYFIVQEYANGGTLEDDINKRSAQVAEKEIYTAEERWAIARQIQEMLDAFFQRGIVHCDLAPKNLFFVNGRLKAGDFNVAEYLDPYQKELIVSAFKGTPEFASEDATRGRYSWNNDVSSFAMVLSSLWRDIFVGDQSTATYQRVTMSWHANMTPSEEAWRNIQSKKIIKVVDYVKNTAGLRAHRLSNSKSYLARFLITPILKKNKACPRIASEVKTLMNAIEDIQNIDHLIASENRKKAENCLCLLAEKYWRKRWFVLLNEKIIEQAKTLNIPVEFIDTPKSSTQCTINQ